MNIHQVLIYYHLRKEINISEFISAYKLLKTFDDIINVGYNIKLTDVLVDSLIKNNIEYCLYWHMDIDKLYNYLVNNKFINSCMVVKRIDNPRYLQTYSQDYIWCINSDTRIYITYKNSIII